MSKMELLYEQGMPIVEIQGEYYWFGNPNDLPEGIEIEKVNEVEISEVLSVRRNLAIKNLPSKPYSNHFTEKFEDGRFLDEDGFLPDSDKLIYKIDPVVENNQYALYINEINKYVCIRNDCDSCSLKENCNPRIVGNVLQQSQ